MTWTRHLGAWLFGLGLLLLCWQVALEAQTTYVTIEWDAPVSFPTLPGGERLVYSLYRRGAFQNYYQAVRYVNTAIETYQVAVPRDIGYVCYRVGVLQAPIGGIQVIATSPWADVQGYLGCFALCLRGVPPYPALANDECVVN